MSDTFRPGGCFVIEVGEPELRRLPPGDAVRGFHVSESYTHVPVWEKPVE